MTIPAKYMNKIRERKCDYKGPPEAIVEIVKSIANSDKIKNSEEYRELFNTALLYTNTTDVGWCKGGVEYSDFYSSSSAPKGGDYTLDLRWWSPLTYLRSNIQDSGILCEEISAHMNTVSQRLPRAIKNMILEQKAKHLTKLENEGKLTEWTNEKDAKFNMQLNSCIEAFSPKVRTDILEKKLSDISASILDACHNASEPEEILKCQETVNTTLATYPTTPANDDEYKLGRGTFDYGFGVQTADAKGICMNAMKLVSPQVQNTEKKEDTSVENFYNSSQTLGSLLGDTSKDPSLSAPGQQLNDYIDEHLWEIPWDFWVEAHEFCTPATSSGRIAQSLKIGSYGALTITAIFGRTLILSLFANAARKLGLGFIPDLIGKGWHGAKNWLKNKWGNRGGPKGTDGPKKPNDTKPKGAGDDAKTEPVGERKPAPAADGKPVPFIGWRPALSPVRTAYPALTPRPVPAMVPYDPPLEQSWLLELKALAFFTAGAFVVIKTAGAVAATRIGLAIEGGLAELAPALGGFALFNINELPHMDLKNNDVDAITGATPKNWGGAGPIRGAGGGW